MDLFVTNFAMVTYPHLQLLVLKKLYISGGRLLRFISNHSQTLEATHLEAVILTDGKWKPIFRCLSSKTNIVLLTLRLLFQRREELEPTPHPSYLTATVARSSAVAVRGEDNVKVFPENLIDYHATSLHDPQHAQRRPKRPQYFLLLLFTIGGVTSDPNDVFQDGEKVRQYAENPEM